MTVEAPAERQVKDDPELLNMMLGDASATSQLYKPTHYWAILEKALLPELYDQGLHDFRRRRDSVLAFLSYLDLLPSTWSRMQSPVRAPRRLGVMIKDSLSASHWLNSLVRTSLRVKAMQEILTGLSEAYLGASLHDINLLSYEFARSYGEKNGARPIQEFEASLVGNPENVFHVDGRAYTTSVLHYYVQYAYCCKFMDFDSISSVLEIGGGFGKQVEVMKKLHPHLCFYMLDLPLQLYVCQQYLSTLFPDSVVSYRQTRTMKKLPEQRDGRIFILGNWKIAELSDLNYDLFWNSASFQEMEPSVVLNYLRYASQQVNKYVFLHERMEGSERSTEPGRIGVLEPTTLEHYKRGLEKFDLVDLSRAVLLPRLSDTAYSFSFWKRE